MTRLPLLVLLTACAPGSEPPAGPEPSGSEAPAAAPEADAAEVSASPEAPEAEPAEGDGVFFVGLEDGAEVTSPLHVVMGIRGMEVEPAGEAHEGKGHHHILIDLAPIEEGTVIPSSDQHLHFGGGQTEADVILSPGTHTLTLQFANGLHASYGPAWATTITVHAVAAPVEEGAPPAAPDVP